MLEGPPPPGEGKTGWTEEECKAAIRDGLRGLHAIIYRQVTQGGSVPSRALRDYVLAAQALRTAFERGDDTFLGEAATLAANYLRDLGVPPKAGSRAGIPDELLTTRSGILEQLLDWIEPSLVRALEQQTATPADGLDSVAGQIVDAIVDDPLVVLPFLEPAGPTPSGAKPTLMSQDYSTKARRQAAFAAARRTLTDATVGTSRSSAMAAIEKVLNELGVDGKPFDFLRKRERDKKLRAKKAEGEEG